MKVSLCQMCSSSVPEKNMDAVEAAFEVAAADKSDLLVFPENMFAMGARFKSLIEQDWLHYQAVLCTLSKKYQLNCIAGTLPVEDPNDPPKRLANSMFIRSSGELAYTYNKIHLFDVDLGDEKGNYRESKYYSAGSALVVADCDGVGVGMTVCFDLRFPALYQALRREGASVIVVPSAFTRLTGPKHWELLLRARAIETQSYILAPNQVGEHDDGRFTWGHSLVISPDGDVLLDMKDSRGVESVELDFAKLEKIRKAMPLRPAEWLS